ncbi:hypothetical protein SCALM49S_01213 [Streptomyces californicus]
MEIRTLEELIERLIVFDRTVAFITAQDDRQVALELRHPGLVEYLVKVFEQLWTRAAPLLEEVKYDPMPQGISGVQRSIAQVLVEGHVDDSIARRLGMNVRTCRAHVAKLSATLGSEQSRPTRLSDRTFRNPGPEHLKARAHAPGAGSMAAQRAGARPCPGSPGEFPAPPTSTIPPQLGWHRPLIALHEAGDSKCSPNATEQGTLLMEGRVVRSGPPVVRGGSANRPDGTDRDVRRSLPRRTVPVAPRSVGRRLAASGTTVRRPGRAVAARSGRSMSNCDSPPR